MKILFAALVSILLLRGDDKLVGSVWSHKIEGSCINTLKFKSNGLVLEYDCEMNYVFHSTYKLVKDTLIISGKDDSHSEDNGKVTDYWITKYLIKENALYVIGSKKLANGKWVNSKIKFDKDPEYKRNQ